MKKLFERLGQELEESGVEWSIDESDGDVSLRLVIEGMGPDEDGTILIQLSKVPVENSDAEYYYYHTNIAMDIEAATIPAVLANLNEINLRTVVGSFGILSEERVMYHKYVLRTPVMDEEALYKLLNDTLVDVVATVDNEFMEVFLALKTDRL